MTPDANPLLPAFPPQFAAFARGLRPAPEQGDTMPLPDLLRPAGLDALAARYGASLANTSLAATHRRAVLSRWAQYYCLVLLPPSVAAALVASQTADPALDTARVALSPDQQPLSIALHGPARPPGATPADRLTPLLRTHLVPLAHALAEGGLPAPVLWGNAAHVLGWTLGIMQAGPAALAELRAALCAPDWVDGAPNPLAPAMRATGAGSRAVCCLRHHLPGLDRCTTCPLSRKGGRAPA